MVRGFVARGARVSESQVVSFPTISFISRVAVFLFFDQAFSLSYIFFVYEEEKMWVVSKKGGGRADGLNNAVILGVSQVVVGLV